MNQSKFLKILKRFSSFLISTHVNPDADGLSSELAMAIYLTSLGKKVRVINEKPVPRMYEFLPHSEKIQPLSQNSEHYDAAIVVDCGDLGRVGKVSQLIGQGTKIFNIDHHVTNAFFGDFNIVEPKSSSTAEVIYGLLKKDGFSIDRDIAVLLYLGIMTDTGAFRHDNTSPKTFAIVGRLLEFGISVNHWYKVIYENISLKDFERFNQLLRGVEMCFSGKVAILTLSKKSVKVFSKNFDLRDRIFTHLRTIKEVETIAIFTEVGPRETRVNFRSKRIVNVARLAAHFGGGGHERASGCILKKGTTSAKQDVLKEIGKLINQ